MQRPRCVPVTLQAAPNQEAPSCPTPAPSTAASSASSSPSASPPPSAAASSSHSAAATAAATTAPTVPTTITSPAPRRTGGRPTAAGSADRDARILDAATTAFLRDGFAATSIERIAAAAAVSKRTLYARFPDKPAAFLAVVQRLVATWLTGFDAALPDAPTLPNALLAAARGILAVALTPQALQLHRLVVSEAARPEIGAALQAGGARTGIERLHQILQTHRPAQTPARLAFLAEQFQHLVLAGPQARALGLGPPLDAAALDAWCQDSVALILRALDEPPRAGP